MELLRYLEVVEFVTLEIIRGTDNAKKSRANRKWKERVRKSGIIVLGPKRMQYGGARRLWSKAAACVEDGSRRWIDTDLNQDLITENQKVVVEILIGSEKQVSAIKIWTGIFLKQ